MSESKTSSFNDEEKGVPGDENESPSHDQNIASYSQSSTSSTSSSIYVDYDHPPIHIGGPPSKAFSHSGGVGKDRGTDTCELLQERDVSVQLVDARAASTQTEDDANAAPKPKGKKAGKSSAADGGKEDDGEGKDDDSNDPLSAVANDVLAFLKRVAPAMVDELESNSQSQVFSDYKTEDDVLTGPVDHIYSLTFKLSKVERQKGLDYGGRNSFHSNAVANLSSADDGLSATCVCWNSTGSIVIASYGDPRPVGWCRSSGYLCCWALSSRDFSPKKPTHVLEHSSHLMCCAAHPTNPSVVAAGSFNGEVLIYDLSQQASAAAAAPPQPTEGDAAAGKAAPPPSGPDYLLACSKIDDTFHREPVVSMCWMYDSAEQDYQLCSVSGDGKVLFWSLGNKLKCPTRGVRILQRVGAASSSASGGLVVGGAALSCHPTQHASSSLWVGSEGGALIRLVGRDVPAPKSSRAPSHLEMKWSSSALHALQRVPPQARDDVSRQIERAAKADKRRGVDLAAVYSAKVDQALLFPGSCDFIYHPHVGSVTGLAVNPFHRGVFASSGSDGECRVYSSLVRDPLAILVPPSYSSGGSSSQKLNRANDVKWSGTLSTVLGVADSLGCLHIYDLSRDDQLPVVSLEGNVLEGGGVAPKAEVAGGRNADEDGDEEVQKAAPGREAGGPDVYSGIGKSCINSLCFNGKIRNLVAAGDDNGVVHVWRLPADLANGAGTAETAKINEFVDARGDI